MRYSYLLMAANIGLLAACSGLEQPEQSLFNTDGDLVEKVIFEVLPIKDGDAPATRASAVPAGGTVSFAWEENDMIGIYPNKGSQIYFKIEDGAGSSSATFDGGGWALKQNASYVSYYPFVADFFLSRDEIPVSFVGQKQIGNTSPFVGARYFLATEPTSSENGVLWFSYKTLNTIINVNATLPAGTYTKASLTIEEPLFVEEGTYSLDDRVIVGSKFTNTLEIELEGVVLTEEATIPIYIMSAPVDLKGKEVTVKVISSDGKRYVCVKTPSKAYAAGTRYGLTCDNMKEVSIINFADSEVKRICVENWDADGDDELDTGEAAAVSDLGEAFKANTGITSFDEFQYFTGIQELSGSAFGGCSSLQSVILPKTLTAIKSGTFYDTGLTSILIPASVSFIEPNSFEYCAALETIIVDENNEFFDSRDDCNAIITKQDYSYEVNSQTFSIGANWLVVGCKNTVVPESVVVIYAAFHGCTGLKSIIIPDSVTTITEAAFYDCSGLETIDMGDGVQMIGAVTFGNCTSLKEIVLPSSLETMYMPFNGCSSLESITIYALNPPVGFLYFPTESVDLVVYVPAESLDAYKSADNWRQYSDIIQAIPIINGHEYVDMGDAGKWATMNIGAESPAGSGDYFAWGETVSKDTYYSSNYSYTGDSRTLPADNDAATANWGSPWRTPPEDEWTMLKNKCTWTWTKENNVNGYKVTSKKNGNSIFIPASGFYVDNEYYGSGRSGYYWASSCSEELLEGYAGAFGVVSDEPYLTDFEKYAGLPVRPVVAE